MHIVQVTHMFLDGGGREEHVFQISKYLAQQGHKVTIVTSDYTPTGEYFIQKKAEQIRGIQLIMLKGYPTNIPPGRIQIPDLMEFLINYPADVIHAHGMGEQPSEEAFYAAKIKKVPFVFTLHFAPYTAYTKLKAEHIWKTLQQYEVYSILRGADKIIAVSPNEKQDIIKYTGYKGNNFVTIPNGFEKNVTPPSPEYIKEVFEKYTIPQNRKYLVYVGSLSNPRKGGYEAIQAFRQAFNLIPDLHFIIIGTWDNRIQYTGKAKNTARFLEKLGKARHVSVTGRVSDEEKYALLSGSNVFISPTTYEAFGIALCEALYCKTPVISTDIGGGRYVVRNHTDGILIKNSEDIEGFKNAIVDLITHPDKAKGMGQAGHNRVSKLFSWEKTGKKIEDVYKLLVNGLK